MVKPQTSPIPAAAQTPAEKEQMLRRLLRDYGSVVVAYSGGVDSAYLAHVAAQELGVRSLAVIGVSPSVSGHQRAEADEFASKFGLNYRVVETSEVQDPRYRENPTNRCYFCKSELYGRLSEIARAEGLAVVIDGTNADDVGDHRPGRAAASEFGVKSPLVESGIGKDEVRYLSRELELPKWDKPASPCLASRIAYGVPVTIERLSKVERGETILRRLGFREFRVRLHDQIVRLEIAPNEMARALDAEMAGILAKEMSALGFRYVTLDLQGYRTGALNEVLDGELGKQ